MAGGAARAIGPWRVLRSTLSDPAMRRLQLASAAWSAGEGAYIVSVLVFAFTTGGAGAVAFVTILRTAPSIVLVPLITALAGARRADDLLRVTLSVRLGCVLLAGAAVVAGAPAIVVYVLVAIDSVVGTLLQPIRGSLLPSIARTPAELVTGNVAYTTGDSLGALVGPTLAAVSLVVGGTAAPFLPGLALLAMATVIAFGIHGAQPLLAAQPRDHREASGAAGTPVAWRPDPSTIAVMGAIVVQRMTRGAITVLLVAAAIDLLDMGDPGVGLLTAAIGLGGLVGATMAVALAGRRVLAPWFAAGMVAWGGGIALVGLIAVPIAAMTSLAVSGVGKMFVDSVGFSLIQRSVPNELRTRVLGIHMGLIVAAIATGAGLATVLIDTIGIARSLVVVGLLPIAAVALAWPLVRAADRGALTHDRELQLLEGIPLFHPLQLATKEELAAKLTRSTAEPGRAICTQGEVGDRFYIVEAGEVEVEVDGRVTSRLEAGQAFGEIALLRDVPRTATVRAVSPVELAVLERREFVAAVTGHRESAAVADCMLVERLGE
jgi:cyclic nucleotide-binding protein